MRPPLAAGFAALALTALAACGTPSADLFVVDRSGDLPGARLSLRVGDGGTVRCDGGEEREITSEQLLAARAIAEDIQPLLDRRLALAPGASSLLRYRVTGESGTLRFADTSPRQPPVLGRLQKFTRDVARGACGRPR